MSGMPRTGRRDEIRRRAPEGRLEAGLGLYLADLRAQLTPQDARGFCCAIRPRAGRPFLVTACGVSSVFARVEAVLELWNVKNFSQVVTSGMASATYFAPSLRLILPARPPLGHGGRKAKP